MEEGGRVRPDHHRRRRSSVFVHLARGSLPSLSRRASSAKPDIGVPGGTQSGIDGGSSVVGGSGAQQGMNDGAGSNGIQVFVSGGRGGLGRAATEDSGDDSDDDEMFWLAGSKRPASILQYVGVPLQVLRLSLGMRILSGLIVIGFLVHLTLTEASFGMMTCTDVKPDVDLADEDRLDPAEGRQGGLSMSPGLTDDCPAGTEGRRLVLDLDVCCYNPKALALMYGVGIPSVLVFAVGIPLSAGLWLWRVRWHTGEPAVLSTLGFLMVGLQGNVYYWEVVVMLRKLAVVAITVLVEPWGVRVQTYSALAVIFAASVLHSLYRPYNAGELNALELIALCGAFLTFEAGLFLHDPNSGEATIMAATGVVFLSNLVVLIAGMYVMKESIIKVGKNACIAIGAIASKWVGGGGGGDDASTAPQDGTNSRGSAGTSGPAVASGNGQDQPGWPAGGTGTAGGLYRVGALS